MIPERLIDEAILSEQIAGETTDTEQRVRLLMMASRLLRLADEVSELVVHPGAPVIPFARPRLVAVRGEAVA